MTAIRAVEAGQRRAESLMTLTVTAYAPEGMTKDANDYDVVNYVPQVTSPAKLQGKRDTATRQVTVGGVARPVIDAGLHLPLDAYVVGGVLGIVTSEQRGIAWEFAVTAVGGDDDDDASLIGRRYMVVGVPAKSYATARRLDVVEVPAP